MMSIETRSTKRKELSLMLKRTIPLLIAIVVVLSVASPAMANHCVRCRFSIDMQWCQWGTLIGSTDCEVDWQGNCQMTGDPCNHFSASALTPLASEFQVASVERIDDEVPAPNEALVAKLDTPKPAPDSTR